MKLEWTWVPELGGTRLQFSGEVTASDFINLNLDPTHPVIQIREGDAADMMASLAVIFRRAQEIADRRDLPKEP